MKKEFDVRLTATTTKSADLVVVADSREEAENSPSEDEIYLASDNDIEEIKPS